MMFQITAFSVMLYGWIHVYTAITKMNADRGKKKLRITLLIILIILYLYQLSMMIAFLLSDIDIEKREDNVFYNSNIIIIAIIFFVLTMGKIEKKKREIDYLFFFSHLQGFFLFGILLMKKNTGLSSNTKKFLYQIFVGIVIFIPCFGIRCIMFIYRPITVKKKSLF